MQGTSNSKFYLHNIHHILAAKCCVFFVLPEDLLSKCSKHAEPSISKKPTSNGNIVGLVGFHLLTAKYIALVIEYANYMASLPPAAHFYMGKQLDWDNDLDADLKELASYMEDWDQKLATSLKLTEADTDHINSKYSEDPLLQRFATSF